MRERLTRRQELDLMRGQLENERSSFMSHWRELGEYFLPRRPQFQVTDTNRGNKRNQNIIDSTGAFAVRTLRSGMMSGITSPARPWFRLTTPDPGLMEFEPVKNWLHIVSQRMGTIFLRTNLYNALPTVYSDMAVFGTGLVLMEEHPDKILHFYPMPIGSYCIANDSKLKVSVFYREFNYTVRQVVEEFGKLKESGQIDWGNISTHVKDQWERGNTENYVTICHAIIPNREYDPNKLHSKYKKYFSAYYEKNSNQADKDKNIFLREAGYDFFPVLAPRWEVTGNDAYGTDCPGMTSLGDNKALQLMQKRKSQAIEKMIFPPVVGPPELEKARPSLFPGDITFINDPSGRGLRALHEVNPQIQGLFADISEHQKRISRAFYEDLFLMMAQSDRRQVTATEINERREEKLLALGPVLEQLNQDVLDPLIDNTFDVMSRYVDGRGMPIFWPPPPKELTGINLKVEYISIMAQAQKLIGLSSVERFTGFVSSLAANTQDPTVWDKVDKDQLLDVYADLCSVVPGIVRPDDKVEAMRAMRVEQQQALQQQQALAQSTLTAKTLSETDTEGENALTALLSQAKAGDLQGAFV